MAEQLKAGNRPKRTIVFATWDAEEWGLIGSTEYVEDDSLRLSRGAVAYFNQDVAAQGPRFGGGGSPSLRATLRDVARLVPDPNGKGSVYAEWRRASAVADTAEPAMGDPGGGSDFAGFYNHLGIPIAEWGFGGAAACITRSTTLRVDDEVRRPEVRVSRAAARVGTAMVLRIANADVLPYDYVEYARTMRRYLPAIDRAVAEHKWSAPTTALRAAIDRLEREGASFNAARDAALERVGAVVDAAADEPGAAAGRARADSAAGAQDPPVVPQPDLRRRREQRLREHGRCRP